MITKRPAGERGATRTDWLDSRHTFSFNRYYDPRFEGFGDLLVSRATNSASSRKRRGAGACDSSHRAAGREASVTIHQDAEVYAASLGVGEELTYEPRAGRRAWVQLIRGGLELNGVVLRAGDGAAVSEETRLALRAVEPSELLLFDLA
jgi:redox-sensitive bicupin YhaK (pirin superfamily)